MSDEIRVALLGVEQPHADFWQVAFRESPHSQLVGVWSRTSGLAAEKGERFGYAVWDDLEALVDACDAVAICSVTTDHAELIELAARRDKGILCEKPVATSIEDCDRIQRVVEETGAFYMQSFPKRFDPINHELRKIVESGKLGTISLVRVRHGHPVGILNPAFPDSWFVKPEYGGGGALLDEGVHGADFIRWLFGEPESVACMTSSAAQNLPVEDVGTAIFRFPNGMLAELTSAWHFIGAENSIEIFGTNGAVVLSGVDLGSRDLTESSFLKFYTLPERVDSGGDPLSPSERRWTVSDITPQFKRDTEIFHQNVAYAYIDALAHNKEPPVTLTDGRRAVEMILAAYRAAESGRVEAITYGP